MRPRSREFAWQRRRYSLLQRAKSMSGVGVPHHAENPEHKQIGIFIAVIAVIMAIITALANNEANKMIVKEVQASNGFAWYQAKRQRSYMNELEIKRADFELAGNLSEAQRKVLEETKAKLKSKNAEYEKENDDIRVQAEAEKKAASAASIKHHWFEYAEIVMHIAVVLCSLTLLTDSKLFFRLGIAAAVAGVVLAGIALSMTPHGPHDSAGGQAVSGSFNGCGPTLAAF
jgi:hypothetical protein